MPKRQCSQKLRHNSSADSMYVSWPDCSQLQLPVACMKPILMAILTCILTPQGCIAARAAYLPFKSHLNRIWFLFFVQHKWHTVVIVSNRVNGICSLIIQTMPALHASWVYVLGIAFFVDIRASGFLGTPLAFSRDAAAAGAVGAQQTLRS